MHLLPGPTIAGECLQTNAGWRLEEMKQCFNSRVLNLLMGFDLVQKVQLHTNTNNMIAYTKTKAQPEL